MVFLPRFSVSLCLCGRSRTRSGTLVPTFLHPTTWWISGDHWSPKSGAKASRNMVFPVTPLGLILMSLTATTAVTSTA